jgi:hypothetical protein
MQCNPGILWNGDLDVANNPGPAGKTMTFLPFPLLNRRRTLGIDRPLDLHAAFATGSFSSTNAVQKNTSIERCLKNGRAIFDRRTE